MGVFLLIEMTKREGDMMTEVTKSNGGQSMNLAVFLLPYLVRISLHRHPQLDCNIFSHLRHCIASVVLPSSCFPVSHILCSYRAAQSTPSNAKFTSRRRTVHKSEQDLLPRMMRGLTGEEVLFELNELVDGRTIGEGSSAIVYGGFWRGLEVAVKVFRGGLCARSKAEAEREKLVHRRLLHPNIVPMLGNVGVPGGAYALAFPLCLGGVLNLKSLGGYGNSPVRILNIALDVARALEHAHLRGVMHRDLKPSQILIDCCGKAQLADWGLSCIIGSSECRIGETGTLEFMAPEIYNYEAPYDAKADVFSFGIVLWCLCSGDSYPYESEYITPEQAASSVSRSKLRPRRLSRVDNSNPQLADLMQLCWTQDPRERPTMTNVLDSLLAIRDEIVEIERQKEAAAADGYWGWIPWIGAN